MLAAGCCLLAAEQNDRHEIWLALPLLGHLVHRAFEETVIQVLVRVAVFAYGCGNENLSNEVETNVVQTVTALHRKALP